MRVNLTFRSRADALRARLNTDVSCLSNERREVPRGRCRRRASAFLCSPENARNKMTLEELQRLGINAQSVTESLGKSTEGSGVRRLRPGHHVVSDQWRDGEFLVIAVLPEYEGKGIGGKLMALAEDLARGIGLQASQSSARAISFPPTPFPSYSGSTAMTSPSRDRSWTKKLVGVVAPPALGGLAEEGLAVTLCALMPSRCSSSSVILFSRVLGRTSESTGT